jgi:uncharacterized protein YktA (UPF0223 family)
MTDLDPTFTASEACRKAHQHFSQCCVIADLLDEDHYEDQIDDSMSVLMDRYREFVEVVPTTTEGIFEKIECAQALEGYTFATETDKIIATLAIAAKRLKA